MKRNYRTILRKAIAVIAVAFFVGLVYLTFLSPHAVVKFETKYAGEIPVVIVEEHHEVLPHWYAAANQGLLPKFGNVLVHIDGHSDFALTEIVSGYPLFRWPENDYEITSLMQTNDAFIMSAAGTGMFNKVIWVWPKWDSVNHKKSAEELATDIGWFYKKDGKGQKTKAKDLCECYSNVEGKYFSETTEDKGRVCMKFDREQFEPGSDYQGDEMDETECHTGKSLMTIEILDKTFLDHLKDGLTEGGSLVLDIDEDYFGTESGVTVLTDAGIRWSDIEQLNGLLMRMICPETTEDERSGDRLLADIVKLVIKLCKDKTCDNQQVQKLVGMLVKKRRNEKNLKFFCKSHKITFRLAKLLGRQLQKMTKEQLKVLIDVGFCSRTTPKTFSGNEADGYFDNQLFQVCHGVNVPNETIVITHTPDDSETKSRMNLLEAIVLHDEMPMPRVVTICRSMRDGYTPKKYFHKIEAGVLDIVKRKLADHNYKLKYDIDLLGGANGWPGRHDLWLNKL